MKFSTLPVLLLCLAPLAVRADDWPQWRGPDRTGVSKETGLLKSWPKDGPKLIWETKGAGLGWATLAVTRGKIFTYGEALSDADDRDEYVTCFDDATGKLLWRAKVGAPVRVGHPSPRSTPTVDGDLLFVISPAGVLSCVDTAGKKLKWQKDLTKDFGGNKVRGQNWGYSESPLVDGDKVVCTPGGPSATMLALNKQTGETVWKCPASSGAGHASIVISEVGGVRVYVNTTANKILGVRATDGKLLWQHSHPGATAVIPTPIVRGEYVFYAAGYGKGGGLLKQAPGPDGAVKVEPVYPQTRALANKHGGIVLLGDHLYGCADEQAVLWCADLKTGKEAWRERVPGSGSVSLTAADGRLYLHSADGAVTLVEASPKQYKQISSFKVSAKPRKSWAHPVVANGRFYLREDDKIFCYDIKDGASTRR